MLKNLKSLFVSDSEGQPSKETPKESPTPSPKVPETIQVPITYSLKVPSDPEIVAALNSKLKEQALPKFDFLKFLEVVASLKSDGATVDEAKLFKMASATLKAMASDKAFLEESSKHYFDVLKGEKAVFDEECANEESTKIKVQENQLATLNQSLADQQKIMLKLQQDISEVKNQISTQTNEVTQAKLDLDVARTRFSESYNLCVNELTEGLEKIKIYL